MSWLDLGALFTPNEKTKLSGIDNGADVTADNPPQSHDNTKHTNRVRELFVSAVALTTGEQWDQGVKLDPDINEDIHYVPVRLPTDFVSLSDIYIVCRRISAVSGDVKMRVRVDFGGVGEYYSTNSTSTYPDILTISQGYYYNIAVANSALVDVDSGDNVLIRLTRYASDELDTLASDLQIAGVMIRYNADM